MLTLRNMILDGSQFVGQDFVVPAAQQIELEEIRIAEGSAHCNRPLGATGLSEAPGFIVLSIKKHTGGLIFKPPPETVLEPGDTLIAIGDRAELDRIV